MARKLTKKEITSFQKHILSYFNKHGRVFAWRETQNSYHILVSEIMLQQTQTERVIKKYDAFLKTFPTIQALAEASQRLVLSLWQGLGYNRRGMALHKAAQIIVKEHKAQVPNCLEKLQQLPGVGPYTAGAICAFAFNVPTIFVETNIRSVYIHFFFQDKTKIQDKDILALAEQTVYKKDPRSWYYALMDYGVTLKRKISNPNKKSAHYAVQSKFEGSDRQIRGAIVRLLTQNQMLSYQMLLHELNTEPNRTEKIIADLCKEGFIKQKNETFFIP